MGKVTVSYTYNVKGWISEIHALTECGRVIDTKRGREIKPVLRGNKKAYYIEGKFVTDLKLITREVKCPF